MRTDVALRDGAPIQVRSAGPADARALAAFLDALSPEAAWFRFLGGVDAGRAAQRLVKHGVGLVATAGPEGEIVAMRATSRTRRARPKSHSPSLTRGRAAASRPCCSSSSRTSPTKPGSRR